MPVQGQGRVALADECPHCHRFQLEDFSGVSLLGTERSSATGGMQLAAAQIAEMQKCFERTLHRKECVTT